MPEGSFTVALAGNPNVGKSTVFNALTGMKQHTGNWPGKTVSGAVGTFRHRGLDFTLVDVPGTYSLDPHSPDEEVARDYICGGLSGGERDRPDGVLTVCDACAIERGLILALQIIAAGIPSALCVNLMDEAEKRGIGVDPDALSRELGIPVVTCAASKGRGLSNVLDCVFCLVTEHAEAQSAVFSGPERAREIAEKCTSRPESATARDRRLDRLFTGRYTALPVSAILFALVIFITLYLATPISDALSFVLGRVEVWIREILISVGTSDMVTGALCDGVLRVLFWVAAVMTPPMAIFFPLFTLLEDLGYLPRVAYNFDRCFAACGSCGKQALTMLMGFGCNAAAVTGCRIIDSPRERLIAIVTNSFIPCNGRFPVIFAMGTVICTLTLGGGEYASVIVAAAVAGGVAVSMGMSFVLSRTALKGVPSSFTIELPPYRVPKVGEVIVRSVFDRTVHVLGRAAAVAAPAGLVIWILGNVIVGGESLLVWVTGALEPVGRLCGMDGVMMCAFILGLPAAEIIVPLMLMGYGGTGVPTRVQSMESAAAALAEAGWTTTTAVCALIFTLLHWPCSTTIATVWKETRSLKWTAAAVLLPTAIGYTLCVLINAAVRL